MTTTKKRRKKRTLTKAELRTLGVSPGLMACWVGPDGRARLEQLTSDSSGAGVASSFCPQAQTDVRG